MDMWVFFEVVVPLLELENTCLIAVTTVLDDDNFYSKLLDIKDENGKPLFHYLNFQLGCNRRKCKLNPAKCFHNIGMIPPWHSKRKHKKARLLLSEHQDLMQRETMGIRVSNHDPVFQRDMIQRVQDSSDRDSEIPGTYFVPAVYVGVDPNGAGDSHYSIVSSFLWHGKMVVCGIESEPLKRPENHKKLFIDHLLALKRQIPLLKESVIVVDIEADYGIQALIHNQYLNEASEDHQELYNVCVLQEDNGRSGVRVSSIGKEFMIMEMDRKISSGCLEFHDHVVTVGKNVLGKKSDPEQRKKDLINQLNNFVWVVDPPKTAHGKAKRTATGKTGGNQDDICMALLHSRVAETLFNSSNGKIRYERWHKNIRRLTNK